MDVLAAGAEGRVAEDLLVQGMLVLMPSMTISPSAFFMRAMAASRVSPWAMILPISES